MTVINLASEGDSNISSKFDYSDSQLLKAFEQAKRPLIYLDGGPSGAQFLGAEFILDEQLRPLLKGGYCLVDFRVTACELLSVKAKYDYTSICNHQIIYNLLDGMQPFENLGFSGFFLDENVFFFKSWL